MTKKDYIKLADTIKACGAIPNDFNQQGIKPDTYILKAMFVNRLCGILKGDNPRFDEERFIKACY